MHSDTTPAQRIADLERQLAAANQELESVLYAISHDLRAPLMAIGGFTDLLLEQPAGLDETRQRYLQRIRDGNIRLTRLLDGLLKLSRVGREPLKPQPLDLVTLAQARFDKLRDNEPARVIVLDAPTSLPVHGDRLLVDMLLDVLIENAWKFTGPKAQATITLGLQGEAFFIKDNGVGFDNKQREKLCKPLQRLHTEKQFPGVGIGLAIAAKIIHLHRGRIWAEGAPDRGATVYFTLELPQAS